MEQVTQAFKTFMAQSGMTRGGQRILVAVSGGLDSMALMHLFSQWDAHNIDVFHLNHGFRAEADDDQRLVEANAETWGLRMHAHTYDVTAHAKEHGQSKQLAARNVRLKLMEQCAAEHGCRCIATAHHADDQAETIVMRILRGTGLSGLRGIAARSGRFIRPLLSVTKSDLAAYCEANQIPYRTDPSNHSSDYFRNRVRHQILPAMAAEVPDIGRRLTVLGSLAAADDDYLEEQARVERMRLTHCEGLSRNGLQELHPAMQRRVLRQFLFLAQGHTRRVTFEHIEALRSRLAKPGRFYVHIPSMIVCGGANTIQVQLAEQAAGECKQTRWRPIMFEPPAYLTGPFGTITADHVRQSEMPRQPESSAEFVEYFDANAVIPPLQIRQRQSGDRMKVFGGMHKKISRLFIEVKIPRHRRSHVPIVCDACGILWVPGVRRAETGRITSETEEIIRLSYSRANHCHSETPVL